VRDDRALRAAQILDATWEYGGETSWIELRLTPEPDGRARFTLEHIAHVDDERWAQFGPGAVGIGRDQAVVALTLHLTSGAAPPDRKAVDAWQVSDEGRQFTRLSSERWAEGQHRRRHRRRGGTGSRSANDGLLRRRASDAARADRQPIATRVTMPSTDSPAQVGEVGAARPMRGSPLVDRAG
jgi:hypothetical protein